ncbi:hypothetical protein ACX5H5_003565 [Pseudomonas aeruginosa]
MIKLLMVIAALAFPFALGFLAVVRVTEVVSVQFGEGYSLVAMAVSTIVVCYVLFRLIFAMVGSKDKQTMRDI